MRQDSKNANEIARGAVAVGEAARRGTGHAQTLIEKGAAVRIGSPGMRSPLERAAVLQRNLVLTSGLVFATLALSLVEFRHWMAGDVFAGTELLAELLIFASALTSSVAGFAFSAFAGGGLAHLFKDPVLAVKILALCSVVIQGYGVVAIRRSIQWRRLLPFLLGGAITVPFAVNWLVSLSSPMFAFGLGVFLITYALYMLARRPRPPVRGNAWTDALVGAMGGITGGLAAFPGAFVAPWCALRGYDKDVSRSICQPYILLMQLWVLACMHSHAIELRADAATATYLAAALLAAHLGVAVFRALTNKQFSIVVHCLLIVSGVSLVAKVF